MKRKAENTLNCAPPPVCTKNQVTLTFFVFFKSCYDSGGCYWKVVFFQTAEII